MIEALLSGFGKENIRKQLQRGLVFETGLAPPAVDIIEPAKPAVCTPAREPITVLWPLTARAARPSRPAPRPAAGVAGGRFGARRLGRAVAPRHSRPARAMRSRSATPPTTRRDENLPPADKCIRDLEVQLKRFGFEVASFHDPCRSAQVQAEARQAAARRRGQPRHAGGVLFRRPRLPVERRELPGAGRQRPRGRAGAALQDLHLAREGRLRAGEAAGTARPRPSSWSTPAARPIGRASPARATTRPCRPKAATSPSRPARASAPSRPTTRQRDTLFAEVLVAELAASPADRSILLTLESVRARVARKVNSVPTIVKVFGPNAQEPEIASNVSGDPAWSAARASDASGRADGRPPAPPTAGRAPNSPQPAPPNRPEAAAERLRALLQKTPDGDEADLARLRLRDLETVLEGGARGPPRARSGQARAASRHASPKTSAARCGATSTRRCASPRRCRGLPPAAS